MNQWQSLGAYNNQAISKDLACPTLNNGGFDIIGENLEMSNPPVPKENAASFAEDHGVKTAEKLSVSQENSTVKPSQNAMSKWAKPAHKSVARAVGYALTLGDEAAWQGLIIILVSRLSEAERAAFAFSTLSSLPDDHAIATVKAVLGVDLEGHGAGMPQAPLFSHMDQAAFWADMAEPDALDAYCLASFNRMAPARQAAFLSFVQRRAVA